MAKLTILLAAFFAILFLVDASVYRTTVIIDDEESSTSNPAPGQRCREQVQQQQNLNRCQQQQNLNRCQQFFMHEIRGQGRRSADNDYYRPDSYDYPPFRRQDPFRACCAQIQRMDAQCRCEGLRMAIQQQRSRGQLEGQEMMSALRASEDLPSRCGVSPRQCRFSSR